MTRESVAVDPGVVGGGARDAGLDEGEVGGERGAILGGDDVRVEIGNLATEVGGDPMRGERAGVVAVGLIVLAVGTPDDVRAGVQRGKLAGGGRVGRLAVLGGEAQARQAKVRLHRDALGRERRQTPRAGPTVEDQLAVVGGHHPSGCSNGRERI